LLIQEGKALALLLFGLMVCLVFYHMLESTKGKKFELRRLHSIEAIDDGVDRAVETGKPIYVTPGCKAYFSGMYAPMTIAGLNVLRYTTQKAVRKGAEIYFPTPTYSGALPIIEGIYREVCASEGKPEAFKRENVLFFGNEVYIFGIGIKGSIAETGCALSVDVGAWTSDADLILEMYTYEAGGINVGGTCRYHHQGTIAIGNDYPLFLDDIYAAGAYCAGDPVIASSIVGGDVMKIFIIVLTIFSVLGALAGLPVISWLQL